MSEPGPTLRHKIGNFIVFQGAWTVAVVGAAHSLPLAGLAAIAAAVLWHLAVVSEPRREVRLVAAVSLVGLAFETLRLLQGDVAYPSGQPVAWLPPYWLVALWSLLAIALNVSLRWLRGRLWLAALLGLFAGPLSFAAGARLGGARFVDERSALITLAAGWFVLMPLLMAMAARWDGVIGKDAFHE